jgi:hypothetical protein
MQTAAEAQRPGDARPAPHAAAIGEFRASENPHQRRLPGPIHAEHAVAASRLKLQGNVIEHDLPMAMRAVIFVDIVERDHGAVGSWR